MTSEPEQPSADHAHRFHPAHHRDRCRRRRHQCRRQHDRGSIFSGVDFVVANTDAQQLMHSQAPTGASSLGRTSPRALAPAPTRISASAAAEEAADELYRHLEGTHMLFVAAGMGGGTGTGAAPVIARDGASERGILTVGVVTKPFTFEGSRRVTSPPSEGIDRACSTTVDTLIVIPNQNLFNGCRMRSTTWKEAFKMADHVLYMGVRGVTDLMMDARAGQSRFRRRSSTVMAGDGQGDDGHRRGGGRESRHPCR